MFDISEACLLGQVKNQKNSDASFVIGSGDGFEGLLASSVPNLQFGFFVPDVENSWSELDSEGGFMLIVEAAFDQSKKDTAFADVWVELKVLESPIMMNLRRNS